VEFAPQQVEICLIAFADLKVPRPSACEIETCKRFNQERFTGRVGVIARFYTKLIGFYDIS
jgi:hypothetical protein